MRPSNIATAGLTLTCSLVLGCAAIDPGGESSAANHEQIVSRLDQCLERQGATLEKLGAQQLQLTEQSETLAGLSSAFSENYASSRAVDAGALTGCPVGSKPDDMLIVGAKEMVWLQSLQLSLPARVDTGAETASIDARNIELFERDGRRWVRFEVLHPDTEAPIAMERKLSRMVSIVQSNSTEPERRPVIELGITMGHVNQTAEFTLSNRSHLDYQVLIGRNILQDVMVVDVSKKNLAPPVLPKGAGAGKS